MKKIAIIILISLSALCTYAQKKEQVKTPVPEQVVKQKADSAAAADPMFVLQGNYQDFQLLKNALVALKFYAKDNTPDVKAVELVEWIDKQIRYQVSLLNKKEDPQKKE